MLEYGRTTGGASGIGTSGTSDDITGNVTDVIVDAIDQLASLPPEMLVTGVIVAVIGAVLFFR